MEVYILDSLLRRNAVVDRFESLIWTERFAKKGDFELEVYSTREMRALFQAGVKLSINKSFRVMTVGTIEDGVSSEGKATLKIKGSSAEAMLEGRVAASTTSTDVEGVTVKTINPTWTLTGTSPNIARQIFDSICRNGDVELSDKIPLLAVGKFYPDSTITEPVASATVELPVNTVLQVIESICDVYDMGYRLVRSHETPQMYFDIYSGNDRTTGQHVFPPIIFSPDLDNLVNTTELVSIEGEKNVAYVISKVGSLIVTPDGVDPEVAGFERRVMFVTADDIDETTEDPEAAMLLRGKEALAQNRSIRAFDGELAPNIAYRYDDLTPGAVTYSLGDIVEMRNKDGATNNMRVTEQIFVADREGERAYPTLSMNEFIMPGTWLAWDYNQVWLDLDDSDETWADQP